MFVIRYMLAGHLGHPQTAEGSYEKSEVALKQRNELFKHVNVIRCWIERVENERTISRYGAILKREE